MKLNESAVEALPIPAKGHKLHYFAGAMIQGKQVPRGFAVKVNASGTKTYVLRFELGGDRLFTIGRCQDWKPGLAVEEARRVRQMVDRGEDPIQARQAVQAKASGADTVEAICRKWFEREGSKIKTGAYRLRELERLVFPAIGGVSVHEIKRAEIADVLDGIEDERGPSQAAHILAYLRRCFRWYEGRSEWRSPIVAGMARKLSEKRERVLTDDELVAVWKAINDDDPFCRFLRFTLLTGCRRSEASGLVRSEITERMGRTEWTLPKARNKTNQDLVRPLAAGAKAALGNFEDRWHAFTTDGVSPISGFSKLLAKVHEKSGTSGWTIHDLRRTARTLMSRGKVPSDYAERCLGHVLGGIRGVYDKYEYCEEKLDAYNALEALIQRLVDPVDNVTPIRSNRSSS